MVLYDQTIKEGIGFLWPDEAGGEYFFETAQQRTVRLSVAARLERGRAVVHRTNFHFQEPLWLATTMIGWL